MTKLAYSKTETRYKIPTNRLVEYIAARRTICRRRQAAAARRQAHTHYLDEISGWNAHVRGFEAYMRSWYTYSAGMTKPLAYHTRMISDENTMGLVLIPEWIHACAKHAQFAAQHVNIIRYNTERTKAREHQMDLHHRRMAAIACIEHQRDEKYVQTTYNLAASLSSVPSDELFVTVPVLVA